MHRHQSKVKEHSDAENFLKFFGLKKDVYGRGWRSPDGSLGMIDLNRKENGWIVTIITDAKITLN